MELKFDWNALPQQIIAVLAGLWIGYKLLGLKGDLDYFTKGAEIKDRDVDYSKLDQALNKLGL